MFALASAAVVELQLLKPGAAAMASSAYAGCYGTDGTDATNNCFNTHIATHVLLL